MMNRAFIFSVCLGALLLISSLGCTTHNTITRRSSASNVLQFYQSRSSVDTGEYARIVAPPKDTPTTRAGVYIESINKVMTPDTSLLLIEGNFANGCARLGDARHQIENQTLYLHLEAWQPANRMCTQMLSPFTFPYHALSREQIEDLEYYVSGGNKKAF